MNKLATWATLLTAGGIGLACLRGADYLSERAEQTAGGSPIRRSVACTLGGDEKPRSDPPVPEVVRWKLPPFSNDDIAIAGIEVDAPRFLRPSVETVEVTGFSGVAMPGVGVSLAFTAPRTHTAVRGDWPLRLRGRAALTKVYWRKQLQPARKEAAALNTSGSDAERERARIRLQELVASARRMSQAAPLRGESTVRLAHVSGIGGRAAKWASAVMRVVALLFLGYAVVVTYLYLLTLKAGDMEP